MFFPLTFFTASFPDVAAHYTSRGLRQRVVWDKGTFLRYLGMLLSFTSTPLPNIKWHWNWPDHLPAHKAPLFPAKQYMLYAVFARYWQYCALPGFLGANSEGSEPTHFEGADPQLLT